MDGAMLLVAAKGGNLVTSLRKNDSLTLEYSAVQSSTQSSTSSVIHWSWKVLYNALGKKVGKTYDTGFGA